MLYGTILDTSDIRKCIAFMLNNQFDVNIHDRIG